MAPVAGEVLADLLLVVPQQPVKGKNVAVADERQAVVDRVAGRAVGGNVQEKSDGNTQGQQSLTYSGQQLSHRHTGTMLYRNRTVMVQKFISAW